MEAIRSLIPLKAEKKNSFRMVPRESPAAYLMLTNHFRASAILKVKEKCDNKTQRKVENSGGGQHTRV